MAGSRRVVLVTMCAGYFLVLLDVTIVNVALPSIGAGLGTGVSGLQWVVDGYAIALASLMLAGGTVGDLYGHKRVVLTGLALFGVASLGCGVAPGAEVLVGCRVLQGAGAALLLPGTLAVITHAFPERGEQARAIGLWAGIGSVALPAGPLIGGALVDAVGWRAVFLVNVPIVAVAAVVAARVVHESADSLGLLRRPGFASANAVAGAMNLGTLGLLFVLTLYLQRDRGYSPLEAGAALLPLFLPLSALAPLAGRVTARLGPPVPMACGLLIASAGVALLGRGPLFVALLLWGIGLGLLTPAVVAAAMRAVPSERAGLASAVNNTARQTGGAIGIAAYGTLARGALPTGLRLDAAITVGLWLLAVLATLAFVEGQ